MSGTGWRVRIRWRVPDIYREIEMIRYSFRDMSYECECECKCMNTDEDRNMNKV